MAVVSGLARATLRTNQGGLGRRPRDPRLRRRPPPREPLRLPSRPICIRDFVRSFRGRDSAPPAIVSTLGGVALPVSDVGAARMCRAAASLAYRQAHLDR